MQQVQCSRLGKFVVPILQVYRHILANGIRFIGFSIIRRRVSTTRIVHYSISFLSGRTITRNVPSRGLFYLRRRQAKATNEVVSLISFLLTCHARPNRRFQRVDEHGRLTAKLTHVTNMRNRRVFVNVTGNVGIVLFRVTGIRVYRTIRRFGRLFVTFNGNHARLITIRVMVVGRPYGLSLEKTTLYKFLGISRRYFRDFVRIFVINYFYPRVTRRLAKRSRRPFFLCRSFPYLLYLYVERVFVTRVQITYVGFTLVSVTNGILQGVAMRRHARGMTLRVPSIRYTTRVVHGHPSYAIRFFTFLLFFNICRFCFLRRVQVSTLFSFVLA